MTSLQALSLSLIAGLKAEHYSLHQSNRKASKILAFIETIKTSDTALFFMKSGRPIVAHFNHQTVQREFFVNLSWQKKKKIHRLGKGSFKKVCEYYNCQSGRVDRALVQRKIDHERAATLGAAETVKYQALAGVNKVAKLHFAFTQVHGGIPYHYMMLSKYQVNLEELLDDKQFNKWDIFKKIIKAICQVHKKGIVHRDIKMNNILYELIDSQVKIKVIDFDLSCDADDHVKLLNRAGTTYYMSPENVSGEAKQNPYKIDSWSLGILLYRIIFNMRPPFAKHIGNVLANNSLTPEEQKLVLIAEINKLHQKYTEERKYNPWIDLMLRILDPSVEKRLSVSEILSECKKLLHSHYKIGFAEFCYLFLKQLLNLFRLLFCIVHQTWQARLNLSTV